MPAPGEIVAGCRFAPRCGYVRPPCTRWEPTPLPLAPDHVAACIRHVGYEIEAATGAASESA